MLFIMRGVSCSGKDTFIKKHFEDPQSSPHVISSDRFRAMLYGSESVQRYNKELFDVIYTVLEARIQSKVTWTVFNATNLKISSCSKAINICKKYKVPYTIISIQPPSEINDLYSRSAARSIRGGLFVPKDVIDKQYTDYINNTQYFVEEAVNSKLCSFIEIDQFDKVLRHVD